MRPPLVPRVLVLPLLFALPPLVTGCARPAPPPAAAPAVGGSLAARRELLAADRALAAATARAGLLHGLASRFADDVALLLPEAPTFTGAAAAQRLLAGDAGARRVWWLPLHVEVSADSSFGITYGVAMTPDTGAAPLPPRHGKYLAAWRRAADGWRLAAFAATGVLPAPTAGALAAAALPAPSVPSGGPWVTFAEADRAFAADAGRRGAAAAFAAFAAPDAVTFPATGDLARGPAEIGARLADYSAGTAWEWAPVFAGGAASGDLGFTVGESVIRPRPGRPGPATYGKYLTLWRRQPDGRVAYVADAGSPRPPAR